MSTQVMLFDFKVSIDNYVIVGNKLIGHTKCISLSDAS